MASIELAALRLVKVPDSAPPYDCEAHGANCPALRDAAAPAAGTGSGLPPDTAARAGVPARSRVSAGPVASGTTAAWPRQFAQVMAEILAGVRPVRQLAPWATDGVVAQIRGLVPGFASDRRPRIQRVVTSRPAADVVEMTVIVDFGPRTRAVAVRFEHIPGRPASPGLPPRTARWLCTAMEAG